MFEQNRQYFGSRWTPFSQNMMNERAGGGGRSVAISHLHKGFFCLDQ